MPHHHGPVSYTHLDVYKRHVVYDAFDIIKNKTGKDPLEAFTEAMNNIMPKMCIRDSLWTSATAAA